MSTSRSSYWTEVSCVVSLGICNVLYVGGLVVVARLLFPVLSPSDSAAQVAAYFAAHHDAIRTGALMMTLGVGFFAPFGALLVTRTRRTERGSGIFTSLQMISFGATLLATFLVPMCFALAAFRPGEDPAIVQLLNDTAWFLLLYIWPLFTVWVWSVGLPVLLAEPGTATLPRWTGHLSLWCGLAFAPSLLIDHLKSGPFAYDGLLGVYVPAGALGLWGIALAGACLQAARSERRLPHSTPLT